MQHELRGHTRLKLLLFTLPSDRSPSTCRSLAQKKQNDQLHSKMFACLRAARETLWSHAGPLKLVTLYAQMPDPITVEVRAAIALDQQYEVFPFSCVCNLQPTSFELTLTHAPNAAFARLCRLLPPLRRFCGRCGEATLRISLCTDLKHPVLTALPIALQLSDPNVVISNSSGGPPPGCPGGGPLSAYTYSVGFCLCLTCTGILPARRAVVHAKWNGSWARKRTPWDSTETPPICAAAVLLIFRAQMWAGIYE